MSGEGNTGTDWTYGLKQSTHMRLSQQTLDLLAKIAAKTGESNTAIVERAIRELAKKELDKSSK